MRTIEEIEDEIAELRELIEKFEGFIRILKEALTYISRRKTNIDINAYYPAWNYDISRGSKWRGNLYDEGVNHQTDIHDTTKKAQGETEKTLSEIREAIEYFQNKIEEYKERISHLEAELDALRAAMEPQ